MKELALHFDVSEKSIVESVEIVKEFVPFLIKMKMYYYFPFSEAYNIESLQKQISRDYITFNYLEAVKKIKESWEKYAPEINQRMKGFLNIESMGSYRCVLTFYGPYGYYYTPDTVYINITKCSPDEWIETLIHELLHLVLAEKIKNLSHLDEERFIDQTFVELFGDIFPNYKVQDI